MNRLEPLESRLLFSHYFVATLGSDSATGSQATPWATLQRAAQAAKAGDTVTVLPGHYAGFQTNTSGTANAPIIFAAQGNAVIDSRNPTTNDGINLEGASFITIQGFGVQGIGRAGIRSVTNHGVKLLDNRISESGMWGILTGFSQDIDIEHNVVGGSVNQHGIYVANSADNPVIRFNTVFNNRQSGIQINSDASQGGDGVITAALVDSNLIYSNGRAGGAAINLDGVQKSTVENNVLYDNHSTGIALYKIDGAAPASDNVIENNTIVMADDARWAVLITDGSTGNFVANNIWCNFNRSRGGLCVSADSLAGLFSDHNAGSDRYSNDDGETFLTLAQWNARTHQDGHTIATFSRQLFADVRGHDFHLADDTSATTAGDRTHLPLMDIDGVARSPGDPRLGAYERTHPRVISTGGNAGAMDDEPVHHLRRRWLALIGLAAAILAACLWLIRKRRVDRWIVPYFFSSSRRRPVRPGEPVHLLLCVADHYEPQNGDAPHETAMARVRQWQREYPARFSHFRDSDGKPPRHTFFYPLEQFDPDEMEGIVDLCRQGFGEVEIHLHHDHDTAENLRRRLNDFRQLLAGKYHQLSTHRATGQIMYGFIHGNWALDNSRPDGRWCGVNNELDILGETGCYADFTLPSAPNPTQTRKINSIYYARDNPHRPMSHNWGVDVGTALKPQDGLMLIQGPLILNWSRRKWGVVPRIENSCVQGNQSPTIARLDLWLRARVQVPTRPDWFFVKLHTHGAPEANQQVLLGPAMENFHQSLAAKAAADPNFHFHYVTAREMYNLARAAESQWKGSVDEARDFELVWNGSAHLPQSKPEILPQFRQDAAVKILL